MEQVNTLLTKIQSKKPQSSYLPLDITFSETKKKKVFGEKIDPDAFSIPAVVTQCIWALDKKGK